MRTQAGPQTQSQTKSKAGIKKLLVLLLCGAADFSGHLPSPWYQGVKQLGTGEAWLEQGYGLKYNE